MRQLKLHSKTPLFLMEIILSLLILSLAATACVQIFLAAYQNRQKAREWNHIQELTISASEILEGSAGDTGPFLKHLPGGTASENILTYYYDKDWAPCEKDDHAYQMTIILAKNTSEKSMQLSFQNHGGNSLYQLDVRYPALQFLEKERAT